MNTVTALGIGALAAPTTHPHDYPLTCRRGCCWTPYGSVCARNWACTCHRDIQ